MFSVSTILEPVFGTYYATFVNFVFILLVITGVTLAWLSTGMEPLGYRLWIVQLFSTRTRRVLQLYDLTDTNRHHAFWQCSLVNEENPQVTTLIMVQKPQDVISTGTTVPPADESLVQGHRSLYDFIVRNVALDSTSSAAAEPAQFEEVAVSDFNTEGLETGDGDVASSDTMAARHRWRSLMQLLREVNVRLQNEPTNTSTQLPAAESSHESTGANASSASDSSQSGTADASSSSSAQAAGGQNSPGVGAASVEPENINVIVRHRQPKEQNVICQTQLSICFHEFKRQHNLAEVENQTFIFQGVVIEDDSRTLRQLGFYDQCVVLALLPNETKDEFVRLRFKHLDDSVINANVQLSFTVGDLKRLYYVNEIKNGKVIRFIFQGQLLRNDTRSLGSYGVQPDSVIHVQIGNSPYRQEGVQQPVFNPSEGRDTSDTAFPMILTGIQFFDTTLLAFLGFILYLVRWAEIDDAAVADEGIFSTFYRNVKTVFRFLINRLVVLFTWQQLDQEPYRNLGYGLHYLVMLKLITILTTIIMFPQIADTKSIVLFLIVSVVAFGFWWSHRQPVANES